MRSLYEDRCRNLQSILEMYKYNKKDRYGGNFKSLREELEKVVFNKEELLVIVEDYINNCGPNNMYDNSKYLKFGTFLREELDKANNEMRPYNSRIKESKEKLVVGNKDYQYLRMILKNSEILLSAINSLYDKANGIDQSFYIYDEKERAKFKDDINRIIADIEYYVEIIPRD